MDTAGSPELLAYPLVARGLTRDATLVDTRGPREVAVRPGLENAPCDGPQQIRVGELARFADGNRTLVTPLGKTIG